MNSIPVFSNSLSAQVELDPFHPEAPTRVARLLAALQTDPGPWEIRICNETLTDTASWLPHPPSYWEELAAAVAAKESFFHERDVRIGPLTFDLLARSAGTVSAALDWALSSQQNRVFAAVRPASHHASAERAMGFCILNLPAFAAFQARKRFGLERIAILDIDAHHGNGTDSICEDDPGLLFISLHQHPYYPFTGSVRGSVHEAATGKNLSLDLPARAELSNYEAAFAESVLPALSAYQPELLIISAGFDAHTLDPMSELSLQSEDYGVLTRAICASVSCPIVSLLEGGYYIPALIESVKHHLRGLA